MHNSIMALDITFRGNSLLNLPGLNAYCTGEGCLRETVVNGCALAELLPLAQSYRDRGECEARGTVTRCLVWGFSVSRTRSEGKISTGSGGKQPTCRLATDGWSLSAQIRVWIWAGLGLNTHSFEGSVQLTLLCGTRD